MTEEARRYALPRDLGTIVRIGFHGLAVQSVAEQVAARLVVCHLGGGCSVTAVRDGSSMDTSMGYTPLEGPPMGTRSASSIRGRYCASSGPASPSTRSTAS